ncbi:MAG TPA: nuclear transport factor 2 family protein [Actinomycetota bacterium]|nr:nuclear transport factor 2 family protein [Actinomycetota bacterium]
MEATQEILELGQRWAQAEQAGDTAVLDAMATDDFRLVGPAGFVLDKTQWLDRYRSGSFVMHQLAWEQAVVRKHGDAAVAIGIHNQRGAYQGRPIDGQFRATHVLVRDRAGWRYISQHLSPIMQPPAQPGQAAESQGGAR